MVEEEKDTTDSSSKASNSTPQKNGFKNYKFGAIQCPNSDSKEKSEPLTANNFKPQTKLSSVLKMGNVFEVDFARAKGINN